MADRLDISELDDYPYGTALIRYRLNGKLHDWAVGAMPDRDNEETILAHLKSWIPKAELVGWVIK